MKTFILTLLTLFFITTTAYGAYYYSGVKFKNTPSDGDVVIWNSAGNQFEFSDSPQFTGIELGHATDTTLTRAAAGEVDIEGQQIYHEGDEATIVNATIGVTVQEHDADTLKADTADTITARIGTVYQFGAPQTGDPGNAQVGDVITCAVASWNPAGLGGAINYRIRVTALDGTDIDTFVLIDDNAGNSYHNGQDSLTPVSGSTTAFAATFTGANLKGGTYVVTSDDGDLQLPLMAVGMNFTIIVKGAIECVAATNAADGYLLDGVDTAEDNSVVSTSTSGDMAVFQYYTPDDWIIQTNGWSTE